MTTRKSKKIKGTEDFIDDYGKVECWWEYQTTSDIFSYYEKLTEDVHGYYTKKKGELSTSICMSPEAANRLYHALSNWKRQYYNEKVAEEVISNNEFDKEEL